MAEENVVALDPGKTTGWALWNHHQQYKVGQLTDGQIWNFLDNLQMSYFEPTIVYEEFRVGPNLARANLAGVEVIGVIKEWARQRDFLRLKDQHSSEAKHYFTDKRLKDAGLWVKGQPHAMDALRHLCYYRQDMLL